MTPIGEKAIYCFRRFIPVKKALFTKMLQIIVIIGSYS